MFGTVNLTKIKFGVLTTNFCVKVDEICVYILTVFVIYRCPPGRVWGSIDPFPSSVDFQGVPCSHLPQHLQ